jgi:hypothetical protein
MIIELAGEDTQCGRYKARHAVWVGAGSALLNHGAPPGDLVIGSRSVAVSCELLKRRGYRAEPVDAGAALSGALRRHPFGDAGDLRDRTGGVAEEDDNAGPECEVTFTELVFIERKRDHVCYPPPGPAVTAQQDTLDGLSKSACRLQHTGQGGVRCDLNQTRLSHSSCDSDESTAVVAAPGDAANMRVGLCV